MSGEKLALPPGLGEQHRGRGGPSRSPLTAARGPARARSVAGPGEPLWAEHPGLGGPSRWPLMVAPGSMAPHGGAGPGPGLLCSGAGGASVGRGGVNPVNDVQT